MLFLNRVQLIGNIGQTVKVRATSSGKLCAPFHLVTTKKYKKNGEIIEKTTWHNVVAWDKVAEIFDGQQKGQAVYIEGELQTRILDRDGKREYITEISVQDFRFI